MSSIQGNVSVQSGIENLGGTSVDISIDEINLENSWVVVFPRHNTSAQSHDVTGTLINSNTLRLEREADAGTNNISWFVIEDSNATVQRGVFEMNSSSDDDTISIDEVDLTKSFISISVRSTSGGMNIGYVTSTFETSSSLRFRRQQTGASVFISWQVVTINDAIVQSGFETVSGGSLNVNIDSVNLENSFLVMQRSAEEQNLNRSHLRGSFNNNSQINFSRNNQSDTMQVSWFVVSCDRYSVQEVNSGSTNNETVNISINQVDLNKSFIYASTENSGGGSSTANARWNTYFNNNQSVIRHKESTSQTTWMTGYVVEMSAFESAIAQINWNNSNMQKVEIGISDVEFEFIAPRNVGRFDLRVKNDIGSLTLTFPINVVWVQGEPDWSEMEIDDETIIVFLYDGEYYYAEALHSNQTEFKNSLFFGGM